MNAKLLRKLKQRKRRLMKRIDKANWDGQSPMIAPPSIQYDLADRTQAISAGGIGLVHTMVKRLGLPEIIDRTCPIFKFHLPYSEADHVLNIAYNLLAGGSCLQHMETRRNDEAFLNALGAQRIPDPTTSGDFCRRFDDWSAFRLQEGFHEARLKVWSEQPAEFLEEAIIEADGTMVETDGERKQGIGMNYEKKWGYHPLVITLANSREVLYLVNREGNRPSHERAAGFLDRAIALCRSGGFRRIKLRGDTDFSQTTHLDRWDGQGVTFVFGMDAHQKLVALAEKLPTSAWEALDRSRESKPAKTRARRPNVKEGIVIEKEYTNKTTEEEWVAEFSYQPHACDKSYRMVVVKKRVVVTEGQQTLFDTPIYFFYITNDRTSSAVDIVHSANQRCDQENIISQLKDMGVLSAPLDTLESNGAYMAIASLAWNLKAWMALSIDESGKEPVRQQRKAEKSRVLRMDFSTYRQAFILIPAQIVRTARRLIYRLLTWTPTLDIIFRLQETYMRPLRT